MLLPKHQYIQHCINCFYIILITIFFIDHLYAKEANQVGDYGSIDSSTKAVEINSRFNGKTISVYGITRFKDCKVVAVLHGERTNAKISKKIKTHGIWIKNETAQIVDAHSVYMLASDIPLSELHNNDELKKLKLDINNVKYNIRFKNNSNESKEYEDAYKEDKKRKKLFTENDLGIHYIDEGFFKAQYEIPKNLPSGNYKVTVFFILQDKIVDSISIPLEVKIDNFNQLIHNFAKNYPFIYGITCVIIAISIGIISNNLLNQKLSGT